MHPDAYHELAEQEKSHWWYVGMRGITDQLLQAYLPQKSSLAILDAGCGTGGNLSALKSYGQVWGLDFSPLALSYAQQSHNGRVAQASIERLPYPDATFDLVTSFDVLYHSAVIDDLTALGELRRVMKHDGVLLLRLAALPSLRGSHDDFVHGARRYTAPEVRQKLTQAHFAPLRMTYANSLLLPLIFAARYWQKRAGSDDHSDVGVPNPIANLMLRQALRLEQYWIGAGASFAAGVSLFAIARPA